MPAALPWFREFRRVSNAVRYRSIAHAQAALNRRAYTDLIPLLTDVGGMPTLYRRGALVVYETAQAYEADGPDWQFKRELGVSWQPLSAAEVREREPALAPLFHGGIFLDQWSHIGDPKRLVSMLGTRVRELGGRFMQAAATGIDAANPLAPPAVVTHGGRIAGHRLVIAAGAWSATLAKSIGDRVLLESERGYNTTLPHPGIELAREVIFAERKFVATPLDIGLRIGGAAEFAGLDKAPNYRRSDALLTLGKRFLSGLDDRDATQWMGHRPATPDSLPVIGAVPDASVGHLCVRPWASRVDTVGHDGSTGRGSHRRAQRRASRWGITASNDSSI